MDTKEVIDNVEDIYDCHSNDRACCEEDRERIKKEKEKVIKLLQCGEKFEKISNELKQYCLILERQNILKEIIRLEQKYFPK